MELVQTAASNPSASVRIDFQVVLGVNTYGINAEMSYSDSTFTSLLFVTFLMQSSTTVTQEKNGDSELPFRNEWEKISVPKKGYRNNFKG